MSEHQKLAFEDNCPICGEKLVEQDEEYFVCAKGKHYWNDVVDKRVEFVTHINKQWDFSIIYYLDENPSTVVYLLDPAPDSECLREVMTLNYQVPIDFKDLEKTRQRFKKLLALI